jgi:hypothetical protein
MDKTKKYGNSSFWMDKFDRFSDENISELESSNMEYYKLASQKKAISNFVSIVTNQSIPVKFAVSGDSYTDGSSVVISSKLDKVEEFDVAVGLALHEGSHIKLSDFKLLKSLSTEIFNLSDYGKLSEICKLAGIDFVSSIKDLLNWVEDRRIDNYIYQTSPGYRDYYKSLYNKYFNDVLIDKALKSDEFTDETFESYMFRLINIHSDNARLDALKGLKLIWNIVDLSNIDRLKSTKDAFNVAVDIFRVICENIETPLKNQNSSNQSNKSDSSNQSNKSDSSNESSESDSSNQSNKSDSSNQSSESEMDDETFEKLMDSIDSNSGTTEVGDGDSSTESGKSMEVKNVPDNITDSASDTSSTNSDKTVTLTDKQKETLRKKIEKQKDFIRGDVSKSKLSKKDSNVIDVLENSGTEFMEVGTTYVDNYYNPKKQSINCILVKNMTKELMETSEFPLTRKLYTYTPDGYKYTLSDYYGSSVDEGIRLGTILGKKMQVRSESRDTVFNRQLNGKLDKRMVASLGYGNTQAFYTKETDMFNKVNLHISVDASGSMGGGIWKNTITNAVALAKAVDMIPNLELQISFRTTSKSNEPYIVIAYDSRKDKFLKIKQLFKYLTPHGTTPEGLCFEAIQKYMIGSSNGLDSFFLNISDGEPYYVNNSFYYSGKSAANHIKKMVDNFRKIGIGVLSYYVSDNTNSFQNSATSKIFMESYGKSAKFIDVTSINEVSKTMNKLFMEK